MAGIFYARVVEGGTTGTIVVRPEGTTPGGARLVVNAVAGPTYTVGQRVLVVTVTTRNARPCVVGVLQPGTAPWVSETGEGYDT